MRGVVVRWAEVDGAARADTAHELLRRIVADLAGTHESEVSIRQVCRRCGGPHGAPVVDVGRAPGPCVSLARAAGLIVVAASGAPVGVDVEPIEHAPRAATALSARGNDGALETWVRLEAVLKATGRGLDVDPTLVDLSPPGAPPRLQAWRGPGRRPRLRLADVETEPGFVAAVARLGRRGLHVDAQRVELSPAR